MPWRRFRITPLRSVFLVILITRYKSISTGIAATRPCLRPSSIVLVGRRRGTLLHLLVWNKLVPRRVPARQLASLRLVLYVFVSRGLAVSHASFLHRKTGVSPVRGGPVTLQITIPVSRLADVQRRLWWGLEGWIALTRGVTLQLQRRRRRR